MKTRGRTSESVRSASLPCRHHPAPLLASALLCWVAAGCNPFERRDGEFFAGAVDPAKFPAAYLGTGGVGNMAGSGTFVPVTAAVKGRDIHYYLFPLPAVQADATDPLDVTNLAPANAYVFDPTDKSAFPTPARCKAPDHYVFNQQQDAVRLDEQGNIFTLLPDDPAYAPVVGQVPVTSAGEQCQDIKSEETLLTRSDVRVPTNPPPVDLPAASPTGKPDGKLLAWAIIDPAARVLGPGQDPDDASLSGLGVQRWGWYNHYLLAYLDGGYLPTATNQVTKRLQLVAQELYLPEEVKGVDGPIEVGMGYEVLQAARGEAGYSPLCHVNTYLWQNMMGEPILARDVKDIPKDTITATTDYVYCLQIGQGG